MTKNPEQAAREERARLFYTNPFRSAAAHGVAVDADNRSAHALEYIAAQLGMIREYLLREDKR